MADYGRRKRRWGRWLFGTLIVLYIVLWFGTRPFINPFVDDWIEEQRTLGYEISYSDRRIEGFPHNFELVFDDPVVTSPEGTLRGEQLRLHSRVWDFYPMILQRWGKVEGYFPGKSEFVVPTGQTVNFELGQQTHVIYSWNHDGPSEAELFIDSISGIATELSETREFSAEALKVEVSQSETVDALFDLGVSWDAIALPDEQVRNLRTIVDSGQIPPPVNLMASNLVAAFEDGGPFEVVLPGVISSNEGQLQFLGGLLN